MLKCAWVYNTHAEKKLITAFRNLLLSFFTFDVSWSIFGAFINTFVGIQFDEKQLTWFDLKKKNPKHDEFLLVLCQYVIMANICLHSSTLSQKMWTSKSSVSYIPFIREHWSKKSKLSSNRLAQTGSKCNTLIAVRQSLHGSCDICFLYFIRDEANFLKTFFTDCSFKTLNF